MQIRFLVVYNSVYSNIGSDTEFEFIFILSLTTKHYRDLIKCK